MTDDNSLSFTTSANNDNPQLLAQGLNVLPGDWFKPIQTFVVTGVALAVALAKEFLNFATQVSRMSMNPSGDSSGLPKLSKEAQAAKLALEICAPGFPHLLCCRGIFGSMTAEGLYEYIMTCGMIVYCSHLRSVISISLLSSSQAANFFRIDT